MQQTQPVLPLLPPPGASAVSRRPMVGKGARRTASHGYPEPAPGQDAVLAVDIETVPDETLMPPEADWPRDKFAKAAWHKVVAVSFVQADILRDPDTGLEEYRVTACRSGGEDDWDEARLLNGFWRHFASRRFRCVTWNGRAFDMPVMLQRSMVHGIAAATWYRGGTRWSGYESRFSGDWHADVMDAVSGYGACSRLTLEEAAAMLGLPGKLGEHGANVAELVAAGQLGRVRAYCETDTLNTFLVYLRHAYLAGRTDADAHDRAVAGLMDYLSRERPTRPHLGRFLDAWRRNSNVRPAFVTGRR
ncbi:3'-5' exonuclease [Methylobacterium sp. J-070]|uniref:3'-5' exonuclease n=1 Tax=Methylobacterium sp. J-070 TaxID=2836650 RepID=UPI001FBB7A69|nr:3'-5' exonuclease [Methylobacterium sp. J-070]MCJ2054101.1 3'-5' exonuclease [Methylobacterium sp. J-070]